MAASPHRTAHVYSITYAFYPRDIRKRGLSHGNVAGCVAGWLSVTRRYCIKTAKPILKLFSTI